MAGNITSTNTSTGTLIVTGGTAITENLNVGGNFNVTGNTVIGSNLTVSGTTTVVNTETIELADNIIVLNSNETAAPTQNAGIEIERGTSANVSLLWDESVDKWTFGAESTVIAGTFQGSVSGGVSGNADTASKLATARTIALTGDVSGSITFDGSANVSMTTTIGVDSVALGTDTTGNYIAAVSSGTPGSQTGTSGLTITGSGEGVTVNIAHADTSSVANLASDNSGNTFIQDINFGFDTFGHVTSASIATANVGDATLTMNVSGVGLSGSATFTANSSTARTFTVNSNATSANTASTIVSRDGSGNFSAGTISANLSGNVSGYITGAKFSNDSETKDDITTRTETGFYETSTATIAEGWPSNSNSWYHLISSTHSNDANYYAMQLSADFFSQNLYYRSTNSIGTTAWSRIVTSGNFSDYVGNGTLTVQGNNGLTGSGTFTANQSTAGTITLSHADTSSVENQTAQTNNFISGITFDTYGHVQTITVSSVAATSANAANQIVLRDANGDFNARYINSSYFNSSDEVSTGNISYIMAKFGDNYFRSASAAKVAAFISGQTMNINGSSTTAGSITNQANSATITASTGVNASHIVQRDTNGYIYANYINFNTSETENPTISSFFTSNGDGWSRKSSLAHAKNEIRRVADGNWEIRAYPRRSDGGELNFYWSGQSGQPPWLWGGSDGVNMYVYNPSNFNVNYAASAGSASISSQVSINYNNDSNSTYQMLWGSGNSVYGTGGIYCNPATDTLYATIFNGTATRAQYADLAENYLADAEYEEGTVLMIGGVNEVTLGTDLTRKVIGVVSKNPAHLMNCELEGDHVVAIALQGRVPVKVRGKVSKGDLMVSAGDGYAKAHDDPRMGMVIGKALEDFDGVEGVIEVVVGKL